MQEVDLSRPSDPHPALPDNSSLPPPKQATRFADSVDVLEADDGQEEEEDISHAPSSSSPFGDRPSFQRTESVMSDMESDRGEGDDDVLYDWDDEEGLDDVEAKFNETMGLKRDQKKRWGVKR